MRLSRPRCRSVSLHLANTWFGHPTWLPTVACISAQRILVRQSRIVLPHAALLAFGDERLVELPAVLYTTFQHSTPVTVQHALEDEVEHHGALCRHFVWRSITNGYSFIELAVLTFKGRCNGGLSLKEVSRRFGLTHVATARPPV
jgi:hypothetical protein